METKNYQAKKKSSRIVIIAATLLLLLVMAGCGNADADHIARDDWADDVKTAVNDFIDLYGNESENYDENSYVVSDFDNTASIFDMCEQFVIYQAEVMGYEFTPEQLPEILASGLSDMNTDLSSYGYGNGSYNDWISDITSAYTELYGTYGPFDAAGLDDAAALKVQADPMWSEFTAKMMNLYCLIGDKESTDVSYPWITYWFTGMTEDEIYNLARESHEKYSQVDTDEKTIKSSDQIDSKVGVTEYTYSEGVQVTENTKELWHALNESGIDVWVCSASQCDIIRAAIDVFGLHDDCVGLIAMTPTVVDSKVTCTYDYDTGYAWYPTDDGGWERGKVASGAQTQGTGKVTAIQNICVTEYGCGPLAGFMDSTGDYNFCTEFSNLKLVICFNRANRSVTDGGSVIAELAMYQKDNGDTLASVNAGGDTLYVLQGRDENGKRTLRNSNKTIRFGETEESLYRDAQNEAVYEYIAENKMSTSDVINTFAIKTEAGAEDNPFGFDYGFLESYAGYHTR